MTPYVSPLDLPDYPPPVRGRFELYGSGDGLTELKMQLCDLGWVARLVFPVWKTRPLSFLAA